MSKSAALAAALVACGGYQAARVFVPATLSSSAALVEQVALRGAAGAAPAEASSSSSAGLLVAGAVGLAALARVPRSVRRQATAAVEAAAEAEAPPPPPPFNPAEQYGAGAPLGFFDPLGFSKVGDEAGFKKLRTAELKHGRVAMMASIGAVIQHYVQFPGFESVPKGIGAVTSGTGMTGMAALVAVSGVLELFLWKDDESKDVLDIGNYGNPAQLGAGPALGEGEGMRSRELENGRAAMIATLGIVIAELVTGKDGIQQLGFS